MSKYGNTIVEIIAALFIILFIYTAINKFSAIPQFQNVLRQSPVIGNMAYPVSRIIPVSELIIVVLLFFPATRTAGIYCSIFLMTAFTIYLVYMLVFSPWLPCSCGGVLSKMSWKQHILFNISFILLALGAILIGRKHKTNLRT
jgi:putative oxidoreductase